MRWLTIAQRSADSRNVLKNSPSQKRPNTLINNLAFIANEDRDFASINRLVWFIDEQVEEEESAREMIATVEAVEDNKYGMYMLDKELAARVYNVPSPLATAE